MDTKLKKRHGSQMTNSKLGKSEKIEPSREVNDIEHQLVVKARFKSNPLDDLTAFKLVKLDGLTIQLIHKRINELEKNTLEWIFDLEKRNMENIYKTCSWGWNTRKKKREMTEEEARYLIAVTDDGKYVAFSHFRFDIDFGKAVLYCYELQLEEEVRRKGLGKTMLQVLELLALENKMNKVVLTVLKHNKPAVNFFASMKYLRDETNPDENFFEEIPYEILSKVVLRRDF